MDFREAYNRMWLGDKVALPDWEGYWYWDGKKETIIIHSADSSEIDIRETDNVGKTMSNILKSGWEVACPQNKEKVYVSADISEKWGWMLVIVFRSISRTITSKSCITLGKYIEGMDPNNSVEIILDTRGAGLAIGDQLTFLGVPFKELAHQPRMGL